MADLVRRETLYWSRFAQTVKRLSHICLGICHPKKTPATSTRDHCRRASRFQSQKEHHRTNIQSQDPLREIPAASAESLPCLHKLQEGLWQGMARSLMGNYVEIQHQRQQHTSHWKSVWQGPGCSPVHWQNRRMVQNYSRSSTRVSSLTNLI